MNDSLPWAGVRRLKNQRDLEGEANCGRRRGLGCLLVQWDLVDAGSFDRRGSLPADIDRAFKNPRGVSGSCVCRLR